MKKSTQLKNWLFTGIMQLFNKIFGCEKPEPKKNEQAIMDLLFKSNFTDLEIEESINIYTSIEAKFKAEIKKRKERKVAELKAINEFEKPGNSVNNIRVIDPIFERPLSEIEIDYTELTFHKRIV